MENLLELREEIRLMVRAWQAAPAMLFEIPPVLEEESTDPMGSDEERIAYANRLHAVEGLLPLTSREELAYRLTPPTMAERPWGAWTDRGREAAISKTREALLLDLLERHEALKVAAELVAGLKEANDAGEQQLRFAGYGAAVLAARWPTTFVAMFLIFSGIEEGERLNLLIEHCVAPRKRRASREVRQGLLQYTKGKEAVISSSLWLKLVYRTRDAEDLRQAHRVICRIRSQETRARRLIDLARVTGSLLVYQQALAMIRKIGKSKPRDTRMWLYDYLLNAVRDAVLVRRVKPRPEAMPISRKTRIEIRNGLPSDRWRAEFDQRMKR